MPRGNSEFIFRVERYRGVCGSARFICGGKIIGFSLVPTKNASREARDFCRALRRKIFCNIGSVVEIRENVIFFRNFDENLTFDLSQDEATELKELLDEKNNEYNFAIESENGESVIFYPWLVPSFDINSRIKGFIERDGFRYVVNFFARQ